VHGAKKITRLSEAITFDLPEQAVPAVILRRNCKKTKEKNGE
jgi:hypothetical protein